MDRKKGVSTFVIFFYLSKRLFKVDPGTFKISIHHVTSRDLVGLVIPPRAYAFMFFDCEEDPGKIYANSHLLFLLQSALNESGIYFLNGRILERDEVRFVTKAWKRVFRKMDASGTEQVIMIAPPMEPGDDGYFQPFSKDSDFTPAEVNRLRQGKPIRQTGDSKE